MADLCRSVWSVHCGGEYAGGRFGGPSAGEVAAVVTREQPFRVVVAELEAYSGGQSVRDRDDASLVAFTPDDEGPAGQVLDEASRVDGDNL